MSNFGHALAKAQQSNCRPNLQFLSLVSSRAKRGAAGEKRKCDKNLEIRSNLRKNRCCARLFYHAPTDIEVARGERREARGREDQRGSKKLKGRRTQGNMAKDSAQFHLLCLDLEGRNGVDITIDEIHSIVST